MLFDSIPQFLLKIPVHSGLIPIFQLWIDIVLRRARTKFDHNCILFFRPFSRRSSLYCCAAFSNVFVWCLHAIRPQTTNIKINNVFYSFSLLFWFFIFILCLRWTLNIKQCWNHILVSTNVLLFVLHIKWTPRPTTKVCVCVFVGHVTGSIRQTRWY